MGLLVCGLKNNHDTMNKDLRLLATTLIISALIIFFGVKVLISVTSVGTDVQSTSNPSNHGTPIAGFRQIASLERELSVCREKDNACETRWTGLDIYIDGNDTQHQIIRFLEGTGSGSSDLIVGNTELGSGKTVFTSSHGERFYINNPRAFKFGL